MKTWYMHQGHVHGLGQADIVQSQKSTAIVSHNIANTSLLLQNRLVGVAKRLLCFAFSVLLLHVSLERGNRGPHDVPSRDNAKEDTV